MIQFIRKEFTTIVLFLLFISFTLWWIYIAFTSSGLESEATTKELFSATYGIVALFGGIAGLKISSKWGGLGSVIGKAIIFFSVGLLLQEFGQLAYSFYSVVLGEEVPFPSIGDLGFYGTIPFYYIAVLQLARASGIKLGVEMFVKKKMAILIPLLILVGSYRLFLWDFEFDLTQPLATVLTFVNPLAQAILISVALLTFLLSIGRLGGIMRHSVLFLLLALLCQYAADFVFLYKASREMWDTAGYNEWMYLFAYAMMGFAILRVDYVFRKMSSGEI